MFHKPLCGDSVRISGLVQDENNNAIENAEVSLFYRNSIKTTTNTSGAFDLSGTAAISSENTAQVHLLPSVILNGNNIRFDLHSNKNAHLTIFSLNGRQLFHQSFISQSDNKTTLLVPLSKLPSGISLLVLHSNKSRFSYTFAKTGDYIYTRGETSLSRPSNVSFSTGSIADFKDILIVSASGFQTVRRAVSAPIEDEVKIRLMTSGVGYITPTIPVYSDKGGIGDVTTYGSASDPENSQGGACNYGSTKIKYYAAINVNQFPGDKKGQWQDGQICGRCARVRVRTATGEERTTVVRIMDKCPDDNCGIDLGGAPAGVIMKTQSGRYAGEWEWVTCDGVEGVSDGSPSLCVKTGSNQWWSLVQARNGSGSVTEMRVRKTETIEWQSLKWATEAENFFKVPEELLQDSGEWDIEIQWNTGTTSTLKIAGNKLSIENAVYDLQK
ncbi:MAG: hypothetical protein JW915_02340 [Chitinispirillaceae bacterium]|nr:hypothetical protein [Chitinispirillaceae bacterium]